MTPSAVLPVILLSIAAVGCARSVVVVVVNAADTSVSDVTVRHSGGETKLGTLQAQETRTLRILPAGESDATLSFFDGNRVFHETKLDVYFESGFRGSLTITIGRKFDVAWVNTLGP